MHKPHEDDLFRESTMTFGEHLEELRRRLIRAVYWLALGLVIGLFIGQWVVNFIESPLTQALDEYYTERAKEALIKKYGSLPPEAELLFLNGYVPDQLNVAPADLMDAIERGAAPGSPIANAQFRAYRISAAEIRDPAAVAAELSSPAKEPIATPIDEVRSRLTADDRKTLASMTGTTSAEFSSENATRLATILDHLLSDPKLYSKPAFADSGLAEGTLALADRAAKLAPNDLERLNWTLLYKALPTLAAPHPLLVQLNLWRRGSEDDRIHPKAMSPTEAFMIYMKASLLAGLILFSPLIFRELWMFVAAGLYPHERRYVYIFLPFSVALFICGALLAFFAAFPPVLHFLFSFNDWLGIQPETRISEWLSLVLFLPLAFGIGFQLPLVMLFVNRIGLVSIETFWKSWRIAILVIFILAPILNPSPDPYSMMLIAGPMTILYFGGILLCQYTSRRKPKGIGGE